MVIHATSAAVQATTPESAAGVVVNVEAEASAAVEEEPATTVVRPATSSVTVVSLLSVPVIAAERRGTSPATAPTRLMISRTVASATTATRLAICHVTVQIKKKNRSEEAELASAAATKATLPVTAPKRKGGAAAVTQISSATIAKIMVTWPATAHQRLPPEQRGFLCCAGGWR